MAVEKSRAVQGIIAEVKKVIVGKDDIIEKVLTAILAGGHILLEDIPGVGKTTLALAFSRAMSLSYKRVQFTPDVLPSDVTGFSIYNKNSQSFEYKKGAVMCNLFLADEINRTSSKTQAALLEVMEEGRVTVDGVTHNVPQPFTVIATQNPIGSVGTQLLPESQMDRFMVRLTMGYPDLQSEINILKGRHNQIPLENMNAVVTAQELTLMQQAVKEVYIHDCIYEYIAQLSAKTRSHPMLELGISPRGSLALAKMAKANAFVRGRDFVIPDDVSEMFELIAAHRVLLSAKARISAHTPAEILAEIKADVPIPFPNGVKKGRQSHAEK